MLTITAVIRVKQGHEQDMHDALMAVARHVALNEPETTGYFISQDETDPRRFTTYERYSNQAAMDRHNNSDVVARFFELAKPMLEGEVIVVTAREVSAKS